MRKRGWLSLLLFIYHSFSIAQSKVCECATSFSPLVAADFESFFDPSLIKAKRFTEVTIYITAGQKNNKSKSDTAVKILDEKYVGEKFTFNRDGYAVHHSTFYFSRPNYSNTFHRDGKNNIVQHISQFFENQGTISSDLKPDITDYAYDEYGEVVKRKKRSVNGSLLPDDKSEYTLTEYNDKGWKIKETTHYYWEWEEHPHRYIVTNYTYTNKGKTEIAKTYDDKKLFLSTTTNYDDEGAPLTISAFNYFMNKSAYKKNFKYDSFGRLIRFTQSSGAGGGSECLEKGSFVNEFRYNTDGFLIEQRHTFVNTVCILHFEYK